MADNRRKSKRDIKPNMRYGHNDVKPKPVNITDSGKNRQKPKQNKTNLGTGDVVEPLRRKATEITTATGGVSETMKATEPSPSDGKKGRVCSRKELRPKLDKNTKYVIDCEEMAEQALKDYNMTVPDLEKFLQENMKIKKDNKVATEHDHWKLIVNCKKVINDKTGFNKAYLKLLIKKYLWKRGIKDFVHVSAKMPTTLKLFYYREENAE